ncbi:Quercetin 2,3-dioxygenase [compost metagenome]
MLDPGVTVEHTAQAGRKHWVQVAKGAVTVNGAALEEGDGAAITGETSLAITASAPSEIMLFDMA